MCIKVSHPATTETKLYLTGIVQLDVNSHINLYTSLIKIDQKRLNSIGEPHLTLNPSKVNCNSNFLDLHECDCIVALVALCEHEHRLYRQKYTCMLLHTSDRPVNCI